MRIRWTGILLIAVFCANASAQVESGRERARQVASTLPDFLRDSIEAARLGDGVEKPWQTAMKQLGVKAARIEVYMTWFFGPRNLTPVRVVYYDSYDIFSGHEQITDSATLARFKASGLEAKLRVEAIHRAPEGAWFDLPYPFFWPFKAATGVTIWDDPWLPNLPHMFTTFGPGRPPLIAAVGFGDLADIDRLLASGKIDKKSLNDALGYACSDADPATLERLVKAGADVNQVDPGGEFGTCLMIAVAWTNAALVQAAIASGAKVNGSQGECNCNQTPLMVAADHGAQGITVVKILLDAGADVKAANCYGLTALMKAANRKAEPASLLVTLISHGADVNARDASGRTALRFAAESGNANAVKVLLAANAEVNTRDQMGRSPLAVATDRQVRDLLTAAGARR